MEDNILKLTKTKNVLKPFRKLCDIEKKHIENDMNILDKIDEIITLRINREIVDKSKYAELVAIGCPPWELLITIVNAVQMSDSEEITDGLTQELPGQYMHDYCEDFFYDCCLKNCDDCWMSFINDLIVKTNKNDLNIKGV